jgi:hypothetical protein
MFEYSMAVRCLEGTPPFMQFATIVVQVDEPAICLYRYGHSRHFLPVCYATGVARMAACG